MIYQTCAAGISADDIRQSRPAEIRPIDIIRPLPIEIETEVRPEIETEVEAEACEIPGSQIEVVEVPEIEVQLPEIELPQVEACAEPEQEVIASEHARPLPFPALT